MSSLNSNNEGLFAIVLNAHTPYVYRSRGEISIEEYWLFDHILNCYLPLLSMLERLEAKNLDYRLTLSLSPVLLEQLSNKFMQERFTEYLNRKIDLAGRESERCMFDLDFSELADYYKFRLEAHRKKFQEFYQGDLIKAFADIAGRGHLKLLTTCATCAVLPLLYPNKALSKAQIKTGLDTFRRYFGFFPRAFWLPECAYNPGVENLLSDYGIHSTFTSACENVGSVPAASGTYTAPLRNAFNFVFFPGDPESELEVWSAKSGYYTDFSYRSARRDLSDEMGDLDLGTFVPKGTKRPLTGFCYYTNKAGDNSCYNYTDAKALSKIHAQAFVESRLRRFDSLRLQDPRESQILTFTINTEFLGCMWYEGFDWLEEVITLFCHNKHNVRLDHPSRMAELAENFDLAVPNIGSWMDGGFYARWVNKSNSWLVGDLNIASKHMYKMGEAEVRDPDMIRSINQALRELMLAQASDWPLMLSTGQHADSARKRLHNHLMAFNKLYQDFCQGRVDLESLRTIEERDPLFPDLDYREFFREEKE